MPTRFIALWSSDTSSIRRFACDVQARIGMDIAHHSENLAILINSGGRFVEVKGGLGLVVGDIFTRRDYATVAAPLCADIESADLLNGYWGGYVALLIQRCGSPLTVLRDPSGAFPCYFLELPTGTLYASDVETLCESGLFRPQVDWDDLAGHLLAYDLRTTNTCLSGVRELLAGSEVQQAPFKLTIQQRWTPWDFVQSPPTLSYRQIEDQLREAVLGTVRAWGHRFEHILLGVSGGLDSSIVAAALARQGANLTFLTMATDEALGDERRYARILAEAFGVPLREAFHEPTDVDVTFSCSRHLPRPVLYCLSQSENRHRHELASQLGIDGHFSGIGGDNVFCYMQSSSPLLDRLKAEGFGKGAFQTLNDICDLTGCSMFDASKQAFVRWASRGPDYRWHADAHFLNPAKVEKRLLFHPWLAAPKGAFIGKAVHIAMLTRIQGSIDGPSRHYPCEKVNPLLSQPIVEFCLTIPTWMWCAHGKNRFPARQAFADLIPAALIQRQQKGTPDSFGYAVVDTNRRELRDMLLGGELRAHDILDVSAVENVLRDDAPMSTLDYIRLVQLAESEAWARFWSDGGPQKADPRFSLPSFRQMLELETLNTAVG